MHHLGYGKLHQMMHAVLVNLKPESSWGIDLGYEYRLGKSGVVGVNVFYRDVSDLIENFVFAGIQ